MSDAGVTVAVGKPGAGKSYYAVRLIVMAVLRGEPVLTNVPLREGWAWRVAGMRGGRFRGSQWRHRKAAELEALVHRLDNVMDLPRIGVPPCGRCAACQARRSCSKEGRALAVLDEAAKFLDGRLWNLSTDGSEGARPILDRKKVVDFFRMHRKRGFGVVLITQAESLLDSQVRGMGERYVMLRNLRHIPHWANVAWYLRLDVFCAATFWGQPGKSGTLRARTEWFLLNRSIAVLYDTMGGFADDGSEDPTLWPWGGGPPASPDGAPDALVAAGDQDGDAGGAVAALSYSGASAAGQEGAPVELDEEWSDD